MNVKTWIQLLIVAIVCFSVTLQALQFWQFKSKGLRFTHQDGIELCQRVQQLEGHAGVTVKSCVFSSSRK